MVEDGIGEGAIGEMVGLGRVGFSLALIARCWTGLVLVGVRHRLAGWRCGHRWLLLDAASPVNGFGGNGSGVRVDGVAVTVS